MAWGLSLGRRLSLRYKRPLEVGLSIEVPLLMLVALAWVVYHASAWDFFVFRNAGEAVLHGHTPYVAPDPSLLAKDDHFVYPTPFALPFVAFTAIRVQVAAVIFLFVSLAAMLAALWFLGVRDRRCYGAAFIWTPTLSALAFGTIGPLLLLLLALGWRYRDQALAGVMLALAAAAKLFLWPVLIWLVVTRRWKGTAAAAITLASVLLVWLLIDPTGLRRYPDTVRALNTAQQWKSYSPQSLVIAVGLPRHVADVVEVVLALAVAVAVVLFARRRSDRRTFGIAVIGALIASPILWLHYLILLPAAIALIRPRLSALWFLPVVLWATPHPQSFGTTWEIVVVLAVVVVTAVATATVAPCSTSQNAAVA